jgi:hypothetical protein
MNDGYSLSYRHPGKPFIISGYAYMGLPGVTVPIVTVATVVVVVVVTGTDTGALVGAPVTSKKSSHSALLVNN